MNITFVNTRFQASSSIGRIIGSIEKERLSWISSQYPLDLVLIYNKKVKIFIFVITSPMNHPIFAGKARLTYYHAERGEVASIFLNFTLSFFNKIGYQLSIIYTPPPRYHNFLPSQKYYMPSYAMFCLWVWSHGTPC